MMKALFTWHAVVTVEDEEHAHAIAIEADRVGQLNILANLERAGVSEAQAHADGHHWLGVQVAIWEEVE